MLPIILNMINQKFILIGEGEAFQRRHDLLQEAGTVNIETNPEKIIAKKDQNLIVFIAGLSPEESEKKAQEARAAGALVNTEDMRPLCDFHMPAQVRRGELLLTVSTAGRSPALARMIREELESTYGKEWHQRLKELANKRETWRSQGMSISEISKASRKMVREQGWID